MVETEDLVLLFYSWSVLIFGGWVALAFSRKSYLGPVEIVSCVFLVLFKDGGRKVSPKCHLYVFGVNQGKEAG